MVLYYLVSKCLITLQAALHEVLLVASVFLKVFILTTFSGALYVNRALIALEGSNSTLNYAKK